nr:hypothetical protein Iba_chr07cCG8080 [Ipomoea batatas]
MRRRRVDEDDVLRQVPGNIPTVFSSNEDGGVLEQHPKVTMWRWRGVKSDNGGQRLEKINSQVFSFQSLRVSLVVSLICSNNSKGSKVQKQSLCMQSVPNRFVGVTSPVRNSSSNGDLGTPSRNPRSGGIIDTALQWLFYLADSPVLSS